MIDYVLVPLREILSNSWVSEENLKAAFKKFSCVREHDLEDFLQHRSILYQKTSHGNTFLFLDLKALKSGQFKIAAFFTTAGTSINISGLGTKLRRRVCGKLPGRDHLESIPTYLIAQFGRDDKYSHSDLPGDIMLAECYSMFHKASKITSAVAITLECHPFMLDKFYGKNDFKALNSKPDGRNLIKLYKRFNPDEEIIIPRSASEVSIGEIFESRDQASSTKEIHRGL